MQPGLTPLEKEVAEAAGVLNVANANLVEIMQRVIETGEWRGAGIMSPAHWLAWRSGLSIGHAREIAKIAKRRADFPKIIDAFDKGELSVDQVTVVVNHAPSWADGKVLGWAKMATVQQLRATIRDKYFEHLKTDESEPKKAPVDRLNTHVNDDNRWRISGEADPEAGAIIDAALDEARDALFRGGKTDVTNIDALVEMANRSLAAVGSVSRRQRHRVNLHLDANANLTTTKGWAIPQPVAERILCDFDVTPIWEREGIPFNQGRSSRSIPAHLREAVRRRDRGSRAPWDTKTKHTEVHHIIPWSQGGATDTSNLIEISSTIHDLIHQGKLSVEGNADDPNGLTWRDERGRILDNNGVPIPPSQLPKPASEYEHPIGGRMNRDWIGLTWIHPDEVLRQRTVAGLIS